MSERGDTAFVGELFFKAGIEFGQAVGKCSLDFVNFFHAPLARVGALRLIYPARSHCQQDSARGHSESFGRDLVFAEQVSEAVVGQAQMLCRVFLPPARLGERTVEQASLDALDLFVETASLRKVNATAAAQFRGQILHAHFVPLRDAKGALNGKLEFAYIARPSVGSLAWPKNAFGKTGVVQIARHPRRIAAE